jgi:hypothetical protein
VFFKQRYIAEFGKYSTKPLSKLLICILSVFKTGLQSYCDTSYSRSGVNQMWILKNSKDMLEYIQSRSLSSCNIIKTFHFSTLYTTIPHSMLNDRLRKLIQLYFIKKNGQRRYKYIVLRRDLSYFANKNTLILPTNSLKLISSTCSSFWLTTYLLSLVDVFFNRQSAYLLGTNYAPLLADLFLYLYEADFIQGFSRKAKILSLNNSRFSDFVERIYPNEL